MTLGNEKLIFTASLTDGLEISTRDPIDTALTRRDFDTRFYLESEVNDNRKCRLYLIPDEVPGFLKSYATRDSLMWHSKTDLHHFYGWTMPWLKTEDGDPYMVDYIDGSKISFKEDAEMYAGIPDNTNCKILENFIGAGTKPLSFLENGDYVNLEFKHLVSKIVIDYIQLKYINESGDQYKNLTGTMIFSNLPAEGIFYREGNGTGKGPMVKANEKGEMTISYHVGSKTVLYICPDVDLSKVTYRLTDHNAPDKGDFFGDFKDISLLRDKNDKWDVEHNDPHVLYAGEELVLRFYLRQGIGAGYIPELSGWSSQPVREGSVYDYSGFYSNSDMRYIYDALNNNYNTAEEQRMFELYGDQEHGEYRLYEDLEGLSHGFRMGRNYVLNGMGHSISFVPYENGAIRISRAKDIYLSDNKGNTVYVDNEFNVFWVNEDGSMEKIGQLDTLTEGNNSYTINFVAKSVGQTNLY